MTPLERALRERISAEGSISVEAYMEACNSYYYATRDPLGQRGDFTTAPEISQMFGEMIGAALADTWHRAGSPAEAAYVELGPGRGTLAADALRVLRARGFAGRVHLVETSPVLRELQQRLGARRSLAREDRGFAQPTVAARRQRISRRAAHPPVRRRGRAADRGGRGRPSVRSRRRGRRTVAGARTRSPRDRPARWSKMADVALVIDYGHEVSAPGDTFQAMRGHCFLPVLDHPGEQDLTSHVDFQIVAESARDVGARVTPLVGQGEWLKRLGIEARASAADECESRSREPNPLRARSADRGRPDGRAVQSHRDPRARLAGTGRIRMITTRDATAADLPAIDRVFRRSFCDTFAHLYRPDDLASFLAQFTPEAWAEEYRRSRLSLSRGRGGRHSGRVRQARPGHASGQNHRRRLGASPILCPQAMAWRGDRRRIDGLGACRSGAARRRRTVPQRVYRQSSRPPFLRAPWLRRFWPLPIHGRHACRRRNHHEDVRFEQRRGLPRGLLRRLAARLPRAARRRLRRRSRRPQCRLRKQ